MPNLNSITVTVFIDGFPGQPSDFEVATESELESYTPEELEDYEWFQYLHESELEESRARLLSRIDWKLNERVVALKKRLPKLQYIDIAVRQVNSAATPVYDYQYRADRRRSRHFKRVNGIPIKPWTIRSWG